jgi:hypothetical protein
MSFRISQRATALQAAAARADKEPRAEIAAARREIERAEAFGWA